MQISFLTVLEAGSAKSRCLEGGLPLRPLSLWLADGRPLAASSRGLSSVYGCAGVFPVRAGFLFLIRMSVRSGISKYSHTVTCWALALQRNQCQDKFSP